MKEIIILRRREMRRMQVLDQAVNGARAAAVLRR